jgi:2-keto-3-deoxy-L-rhamnonate aldolase RhmA
MPGDFRSRLRNGEKLIGTMVTLAAPAVVEVLAEVGLGWLFLDAEHGPLETGELQGLLHAAGDRIPCLVRVPAAGEVPIKKALDLGAAGVIVPQVNTPEQAQDVVRFCRYPPEGARGVGIARAHGYGLRFQQYVATANAQTAVVVQAEHIQAVENIERIVAVPGIDAVLVGPYDLSASLGRMGDIEHPSVREAIAHVTSTCRLAGIPVGIFGVTAAAIRPYIENGYTLIVAGVDTLMLGHAAKGILTELR